MGKKIQINSKLYEYTVEFTDDFYKQLKNYDDTTAFVVDKNIYELYYKAFRDMDADKIFLMNAVEQEKNMDTVIRIIDFLQKTGVRKNWTIVCVGGGITQDVTTIAADLFLRNINWHFFPTTLLAMCDSCIGGKCGINLGNYKNQIGVFYPPRRIVIDTVFLQTLSHEDYINGWGEILKFSLTAREDFYEELKREKQFIPCEKIGDYIQKGLEVKKEIVEEDEFEGDKRRILNYGHTFGHALEAYTSNMIPHGKGVIWGIDVVNYIAYRENLISRNYYLEIKQLIKKVFIKEEIEVKEPDNLFEIIRTDKKVKNDTVYLAVLDAPSHLIIHPMEIDGKLKQYYMEYIKETHEYYSN